MKLPRQLLVGVALAAFMAGSVSALAGAQGNEEARIFCRESTHSRTVPAGRVLATIEK